MLGPMIRQRLNRLHDAGDTQMLMRQALSIICFFSGSFLALVLSLLLARLLPLAEYGLYSILMSSAAILCGVALCGFDIIVMRELPRLTITRGAYGGLVTAGLIGIAGASVLVLVLVLVVHYFLPVRGLTTSFLLTAFTLVPILTVIRFYAALLVGAGHPLKGQFPERFLRDGVAITLIGVCYFCGFAVNTAYLAILFMIAGALFAAFVMFAVAWPLGIYPDTRIVPAARLVRGLLPSALTLTMLSASQMLLLRLNVFSMGELINASAAGLYSAALTISEIGGFPALATSMIRASAITQAYHRGESPLDAVHTAQIASVALTVLFVSGAFFFGKNLLTALFGPAFAQGYIALTVLLSVHCVRAIAGFPLLILTLTGAEHYALRCILLSLPFEASLGAGLIVYLGITGAAIGTLCVNIFLQFFLWRRMKCHLATQRLLLRDKR